MTVFSWFLAHSAIAWSIWSLVATLFTHRIGPRRRRDCLVRFASSRASICCFNRAFSVSACSAAWKTIWVCLHVVGVEWNCLFRTFSDNLQSCIVVMGVLSNDCSTKVPKEVQGLSGSGGSFLSTFSALIGCIPAPDHAEMTFSAENPSILAWEYSVMNSCLLISSPSWQIALISSSYQCPNALNTPTSNGWVQWVICRGNVTSKIRFFMQNSWNGHATWLSWPSTSSSHHSSELGLVLGLKWIVNQWYPRSLLVHPLGLMLHPNSGIPQC